MNHVVKSPMDAPPHHTGKSRSQPPSVAQRHLAPRSRPPSCLPNTLLQSCSSSPRHLLRPRSGQAPHPDPLLQTIPFCRRRPLLWIQAPDLILLPRVAPKRKTVRDPKAARLDPGASASCNVRLLRWRPRVLCARSQLRQSERKKSDGRGRRRRKRRRRMRAAMSPVHLTAQGPAGSSRRLPCVP